MKLLPVHLSPFCCHILSLKPTYPISVRFSKTLSLHSSLDVRGQVLNPYKTTRNVTAFRIHWQPSSDTEMQMQQSSLWQLVTNCLLLPLFVMPLHQRHVLTRAYSSFNNISANSAAFKQADLSCVYEYN